jgi:hypothetical protein
MMILWISLTYLSLKIPISFPFLMLNGSGHQCGKEYQANGITDRESSSEGPVEQRRMRRAKKRERILVPTSK